MKFWFTQQSFLLVNTSGILRHLLITRCCENVNLSMCVDVLQRLWLLLFLRVSLLWVVQCNSTSEPICDYKRTTTMFLWHQVFNIVHRYVLSMKLAILQFGAKVIWTFLSRCGFDQINIKCVVYQLLVSSLS